MTGQLRRTGGEGQESTEIAATPREIMEVIADFEAYPEWVSQMESAKILERDQEGRPAKASFRVDSPLLSANYTLAFTYLGEDRGMAWKYEAGSLRDLTGSYVLDPLEDGRTRVTYKLTVELGIPLPGPLKRLAAKQIVKSALLDLKTRAERQARA